MSIARVVVVGAGIAGCTVSYELLRAGVGVTLVEAGEQGPATSAGAGIIQPWSTAATGSYAALYVRAAERYPSFVEELGEHGVGAGDIGFRRCGALVVNADERVVDAAERVVRERSTGSRSVGVIERVDAARARTLFPPLAEGRAGLHVSGGARVDGRLLSAALRDVVVRLGGSIVRGEAQLASRSGGVEVSVDGTSIGSDAVVVATGAWTDRLLAPLGLTTGIRPQRGQITHLRLDGVDTSMWPSLSPLADHYMVAFDDSRVVVGATRETGSGFDPRVTAAGQRHVLDNALQLAPGLADSTFIETRVGLRPMRDDALPVIGRTPIDALYLASGYGAGGLTIAPFVAGEISELITEGRSSYDLSPFALTAPI